MHVPRFGELNDCWSVPTYVVKVRGLKYLWGSAGISGDLSFKKALTLHIQNDFAGEAITIGTQVAAGTKTTIGTIQPGECVSIPMADISGVYATCALESVVHCLIY